MEFASIEEVIDEIRNGRMVIVTDDEDRENEGDLVMAAQFATPDAVNFMTHEGRGLICATLPPERAEALQLNLMTAANTERMRTAFTVSVDAMEGTVTGISAHDRSATLKVLADPASRPDDLMRPGHIFPIIAKPGGVLKRAGHTESSVDLARLAGVEPVGTICEILNEDGTMARLPQLQAFAEKHGLKMCTVADIIAYRLRREQLVKHVASVKLPTKWGNFVLHAYESEVDRMAHLALCVGGIRPGGEKIGDASIPNA